MFNYEEFINNNKKLDEDVDVQVLAYIYNFLTCKSKTNDDIELIRSLFLDEYGYYFAYMLKIAFKRGDVCCTVDNHFIWLDDDFIAYDINGVSPDDTILFLASSIADLNRHKHIPIVSSRNNTSHKWSFDDILMMKKYKLIKRVGVVLKHH
jgi:hypothetical protein